MFFVFFFSSLLVFILFTEPNICQPAFPTLSPLSAALWTARETTGFVATPSGTFFIVGGWINGAFPNDVWKSLNGGSSWTEMRSDNSINGWSPKRNGFTVAFLAGQSKLVLAGGYDGGAHYADVWTSVNEGTTWTRTVNGVAFSSRAASHLVAIDENTLLLLGGSNGGTYYNDVWSTSDGSSWTRVSANAPWSRRSATRAVPFNGRLFMLSGDSGSGALNDVWSTGNGGSTWQLEHSHGTGGSFPPTMASAVFVWANTLYVLTGWTGSANIGWVYFSSTGTSFTQTTSLLNAPARRIAAVGLFSNNIVIMGGNTDGIGVSNDVWTGTFTAISGDPTFTGFNGARYQVHGSSGRIYNLITSVNDNQKNGGGGGDGVQINARFTFLSHGASRDLAAIRQRLNDNHPNRIRNHVRLSSLSYPSSNSFPQLPPPYTVNDLPRTASFHHAGNYLTQIAIITRNPLLSTSGASNSNWIKILIEAGPYERGLKLVVNGKQIQAGDKRNESDFPLVSVLGLHDFFTPFSISLNDLGGWLSVHIDNADYFLNIKDIQIKGKSLVNHNHGRIRNNLQRDRSSSENPSHTSSEDREIDDDDNNNNSRGGRVLDGLLGCSYGVDADSRLPLNDIDDYMEADNNLFGQNFAVNLLQL